jgi:spore maturation protein CgeB
MKLFYYWKDDRSPMSYWQHIHLLSELKQKHEVFIFDLNNYNSNMEIVESFEFLIKNSEFDLFFTCLHQDYLFQSIFDTINSLGIPKLLICFDNLHAPFMHLGVANKFDLVWLTSKETDYLFRARGVKTICLPYAANPNIFCLENQSTLNRLCFIGSPYGTRPYILNKISSSGVNLDVYFNQNSGKNIKSINLELGNDILNCLRFDIGRKLLYSKVKFEFQRIKNSLNDHISLFESVSFSEMYRLYRSYSLVLNLTELRNTAVLKYPIQKLHLRTFEIPASGGIQIVRRSDEILSYFKDNVEVLTYEDSEELISKSLFYSKPAQNDVINQMRVRARLRVINEHTWNHRFDKIFSILFS